jgi:hypothetical protein
MFDNAQFTHRQFIDLEHAKARLLDRETANHKAADRQRPDGDRAEGRRAERKRQEAGSRLSLGSV